MNFRRIESNNDIKKLHKFFYDLDIRYVSRLDNYKKAVKNGRAFGLFDNDKIVGGIMMYADKEKITVVNYYIPKGSRHTSIYLDFLRELTIYNGMFPKFDCYIKSFDVSEYKRLVEHIKDDIYKLNVPKTRFL